MRLTENYAQIVRLAVTKAFGANAQVWLLGDYKNFKCCDEIIHLLVCPDPAVSNHLLRRKSSLLAQLEQTIGQYKVEVTLEECDSEETCFPVQLTHKTGIRL
ncbi:MAG: hypothetical protein WAT53_05640 [Nitrosomonas sp.]|jgi:hypothetical protein|nr:hypothetical protein [Nitrosomonas sp.]MCC7135182.1 hypothetical protein [Nitrosomonas sp.]